MALLKKNNSTTKDLSKKDGFFIHFLELRTRIFRCFIVLLVVFLCLFYFSQQIYTLLASPLLKLLPDGRSLIATEIISPFITPLKLTFALSVFIVIPFLLQQLWGFVSPALYQKEKRWIGLFLVSSVLLFYLGVFFCCFLVLPMILSFFTNAAPNGVEVMPDISAYLSFTLRLFFAFGIAFEVPILIILLVWTGVMTTDNLKQKRPYIIVMCFIVGMLLTPPDIISQIMLAIPLLILFEIGLFVSKLLFANKQKCPKGDADTA